MLQNLGKRDQRRAYPICGYVGPNGGGKSAAMVWDTLATLERGRPVLSTVRLLDYENPRECEGCDDLGHVRPVYGPLPRDENGKRLPDAVQPVIGFTTHLAAHPLYTPLTGWEQLLEAERCDVLLDEVTGVASSRESHGMPSPVANKLVQLRRADVVVRWSAPSWARADKIIRECSQAVTYCQGFMSKKVEDEDGARLWSQRRLFKWRTYDAALFEDFTAGKRDQLGAMFADWHWGPKSPAFSAYDTYDSVATVGTVSDSGRCYRCGGSRPIPKCSCEAHTTGRRRDVAPVAPASAKREDADGDAPVVGRRVRRADAS